MATTNQHHQEHHHHDEDQQLVLAKLLAENKRLSSENARLLDENAQLLAGKKQQAKEWDDLFADALDTIQRWYRSIFMMAPSLVVSPRGRGGGDSLAAPRHRSLRTSALKTNRSLVEFSIEAGRFFGGDEHICKMDDIPQNLRDDTSLFDFYLVHWCPSCRVDSSSSPHKVLEAFPPLRRHPQFWHKTFTKHTTWEVHVLDFFVETVRYSAPPATAFSKDVSLIVKVYHSACNKSCHGCPLSPGLEHNKEQILELLDPSLRGTREYVDALDASLTALRVIPHETQRRFAVQICRKLDPYGEAGRRLKDQPEITRLVAPDLWKYQSFLVAWFEYHGEELLADKMSLPWDLQNSAAFWMEVAVCGGGRLARVFEKHCPHHLLQDDVFMRSAILAQCASSTNLVRLSEEAIWNRLLFNVSSESVRNEKDVALSVLEKWWEVFFQKKIPIPWWRAPRVDWLLPQALREDFDVQICALDGFYQLGENARNSCSCRRQLESMQVRCGPRAREKVALRTQFVENVLPMFSNKGALKMLVADPETTNFITTQLAEYLGVDITPREWRWLCTVEHKQQFFDEQHGEQRGEEQEG